MRISPGGIVLAALIGCAWATHPAVCRAQLAPAEATASLRTAAEFDVSLFASEPLVTNPAAIDVDTHGRVWVAEIQWYRRAAKSPPADKIKVLEDTDGDGVADKATVFADDLFAPMSVCVAGDKVYVATSPDLWVYEDKDGDLRADGPPRKLLTGFGGRNHDHGAHSIVLGPDHKWWMAHGDRGFDVTGRDGSRIQYGWGAVLRGELDGSELETVAVNFRNPYEVCVSSFGEAYLSDNDNDGNESVRICWIVEGGNYGWFGGPPFGKRELDDHVAPADPFRAHWHFRGHVPGYVPATLVTGFGSPCGICFYEGDAFGPKYKNAPLHADAGPGVCRVYRHRPNGFGMQASSQNFLRSEGDPYFRPDDVCVAPDGRLYVADWYDGGVGGHAYNNPNQGRLYVLVPKGRQLRRGVKPGPYTNTPDAIAGLKSPNLATQYLARERLLADGQASVAALGELLADAEPNHRARALWVLDRIGSDACRAVVEQLRSPEPEFRALAVRILRRHGDEHAAAILALADDPSPLVRREVLLAAGRLDSEQAFEALAQIAAEYDGSDRYLLETIHIAAARRRSELLARLERDGPLAVEQLPLLQLLSPERAAAQIAAQLAADDLDESTAQALVTTAANIAAPEAGWALLKLSSNSRLSSELRRVALRKVAAGATRRGGWSAIRGQPALAQALGDLLADEELRGTALAAVDTLRLRTLGDEVLAIARSPQVADSRRKQAIDVSARLKSDGTTAALRELLSDPRPAIARAAFAGLIELQDVEGLRDVVAGNRLADELRPRAIEQAATTTSGAILLFRLLEEGRLSDQLKRAVLAKATAHVDANVRALYEPFVPEDRQAKRLGSAVSAAEILALTGDADRGRTIFFKSSAAQCQQCHAVQGFGGTTGPELSRIGAKYERAALLETILNPSKAIAPEYEPYLLETTSGQVRVGFLTERSDDHVVLRDVQNRRWRIASDEIEALVPQQKSLMPELILSEVTAQDAADLLAFLSSLK